MRVTTMDDEPATAHAEELVARMRRVVMLTLIAAVALFPVSDHALAWFMADLGVRLHSFSVYEVLTTRIFLAAVGALVMAAPYGLYQLQLFLRPGLTDQEYRVISRLLPASLGLTLVGSVLSYIGIVRPAVAFFQTQTLQSGTEVVWGLFQTVGFAIRLSAVGGLLLQLPLLLMGLLRAGIVDGTRLRQLRPWVYVGTLGVAAVATPPDVVSQLALTVPVVVLYEATLRFHRLLEDSG